MSRHCTASLVARRCGRTHASVVCVGGTDARGLGVGGLVAAVGVAADGDGASAVDAPAALTVVRLALVAATRSVIGCCGGEAHCSAAIAALVAVAATAAAAAVGVCVCVCARAVCQSSRRHHVSSVPSSRIDVLAATGVPSMQQ